LRSTDHLVVVVDDDRAIMNVTGSAALARRLGYRKPLPRGTPLGVVSGAALDDALAKRVFGAARAPQ
jgi:hypothetical protein